MKRNLQSIAWLFAFTLISGHLLANHIVGGELKMRSTGGERFEISLVQFWDKNNLIIPSGTTAGNRDPTAELYIYSKRSNTLMDRLEVTYRSTTSIEYQNKACATSRSLETVTGIYTGSISLSAQRYNESEGYYVVWERCCRNGDINNIRNPGENGMVFYLEFPPTTQTNSAPEFLVPNGQYICNKRDFTMNMSAQDQDGDELRYSLVTPMRGYTSTTQIKGDDSRKTSYPLVSWVNGISLSNVIPGSQPLSVNNSGMLRVTASQIGLYVFTVQCEEYRNGKRIGLIRRDFQLLVIDCNDETPVQPQILVDTRPVTEVAFCAGKPIQLATEVSAEWSYQWQLNGLNIPGATTANIMVKDTGNYSVVKSFSKKCSKDTSSAVVKVKLREPIEAVITASKEIFCEGESVTLLVNGGNIAAGLTCAWTLNAVALTATDPRLVVKDPGLYQVLVSDKALGCSGNDTLTLGKDAFTVSLPEKASMSKGSRITLNPTVKPPKGNYMYSWTPGNASEANPIVSPVNTTSYKVTVTSENGCVSEAVIEVLVVDKLHIPTAFSPNSDGLNDRFEIFNAENQIEKITIFNRWGEVIFGSIGYQQPWDGTYKNKPAPAGTYPYIIQLLGQVYKGEIMLLR